MPLRADEWDRGPFRPAYRRPQFPCIAQDRKRRLRSEEELLEPRRWSPLDSVGFDMRSLDADRVSKQPSVSVVVNTGMSWGSRDSVAASSFQDAGSLPGRRPDYGRWEFSQSYPKPVVVSEEVWMYDGDRGHGVVRRLERSAQEWEERPLSATSSRVSWPRVTSGYDDMIVPSPPDTSQWWAIAAAPSFLSHESARGYGATSVAESVRQPHQHASRESRPSSRFHEHKWSTPPMHTTYGQFSMSYGGAVGLSLVTDPADQTKQPEKSESEPPPVKSSKMARKNDSSTQAEVKTTKAAKIRKASKHDTSIKHHPDQDQLSDITYDLSDSKEKKTSQTTTVISRRGIHEEAPARIKPKSVSNDENFEQASISHLQYLREEAPAKIEPKLVSNNANFDQASISQISHFLPTPKKTSETEVQRPSEQALLVSFGSNKSAHENKTISESAQVLSRAPENHRDIESITKKTSPKLTPMPPPSDQIYASFLQRQPAEMGNQLPDVERGVDQVSQISGTAETMLEISKLNEKNLETEPLSSKLREQEEPQLSASRPQMIGADSPGQKVQDTSPPSQTFLTAGSLLQPLEATPSKPTSVRAPTSGSNQGQIKNANEIAQSSPKSRSATRESEPAIRESESTDISIKREPVPPSLEPLVSQEDRPSTAANKKEEVLVHNKYLQHEVEGEKEAKEPNEGGSASSEIVEWIEDVKSHYNEEAEGPLRGVFEASNKLYPESRFVIFIAVVCAVWIGVVYWLSSPAHVVYEAVPNAWFPSWHKLEEVETNAPVNLTTLFSHVYICSTDYCVKEAAFLTSLFSTGVPPCGNFYQHVCQAWERSTHTPLSNAGISISRDTILQDAMRRRALDYILHNATKGVLLVKELYHSCMSSGEESVTDLRNMLIKWPVGDWPLGRATTASYASQVWSMAGKMLRDFGIAALVGVTFGRHRARDETTVELRLPRIIFFKGDHAKDFDILSMFGTAIEETVNAFGGADILNTVTSDIMSVFTALSERYPTAIDTGYKVLNLHELSSDLQTFLTVVFKGMRFQNRTIVLRNPSFFVVGLPKLFSGVSVRALLNYLGFRLIIALAPFLPRRLSNIRKIFSIEAIGRTIAPDRDWLLCFLAVEKALPLCMVKAHARLRLGSGTDVTSRIWLSQLEGIFSRNVRNLRWMDGATYTLVRKYLRRHRLARFFPAWALKSNHCEGSDEVQGNGPVRAYHEVYKRTQQDKLRHVERKARPLVPGLAFDTYSRYSVPQRTVYVPLGLVNDSVPGNSSLFALHLSRVAVRFFSSLMQIVYSDNVVRKGSSQEVLEDLLACLVRDFDALPSPLRSTPERVITDSDDARYAMLSQAAALRLSYSAFKELLQVQRLWKLDFRLQNLDDVSSEQLFFLYYALDNCERSDLAFQIHEYLTWKRLPPQYRVNWSLRQLPEFWEAFNCGEGSAMRLPADAVCEIFNASRPLRFKARTLWK